MFPLFCVLRYTHSSVFLCVALGVCIVHVQSSHSRAHGRAYAPKLSIAWHDSCAGRQAIEAGGVYRIQLERETLLWRL